TTPGNQPLFNYLLENHKDGQLSEEQVLTVSRQLLAEGADPEAIDPDDGLRPIQHALLQRLPAVSAELLPRIKETEGVLWTAIENEDYGAVRKLIELGADVHSVRMDCETPITAMVRANQPDMIKFLLDRGAAPLQLAPEGQAPIPMAIALANEEAAIALIEHEKAPEPDTYLITPASIEYRDHYRKKYGQFDFYTRKSRLRQVTPLMAAVMMNQQDVVLKLIEKGANRTAGTAPIRVYPIQMAAVNKNVPMQQILIGVPWQDDQQERHFVINLAKQRVTFFKGDEVIKTSSISSGRQSHPTEPGRFVITDKTKMNYSNLYGGSEMPYFQRFSCTAVGFHQGALPGYPASHGCIRLPMSTAKFFYQQSKLGDRVEIVSK
ncbi:MAG: L,D-transpeptidase family protein, partial [Verrucomicrobiota bacterium]